MTSINLINALQYVENCDNISLEVLETIENMKIETVKKIHSFLVTPPKDGTKQGRWQTYVKGEDGRKKITSTTEKGLYRKLIGFYSIQQITLRALYPQWIEKREMENISDRSIRRNEQHWAKYYLPHAIIDIPLNRLSIDTIEKFLYGAIKEYGITVKELGNMKFILTDMLRMAKRKGYIMVNPCLELDIKTHGCKPKGKTKNTSRVYLPHEREFLFKAMKDELVKNPNYTDIYAVFLLFRWGIRIGELCAIRWESINLFEREIHIHAMETMEKDSNGN